MCKDHVTQGGNGTDVYISYEEEGENVFESFQTQAGKRFWDETRMETDTEPLLFDQCKNVHEVLGPAVACKLKSGGSYQII